MRLIAAAVPLLLAGSALAQQPSGAKPNAGTPLGGIPNTTGGSTAPGSTVPFPDPGSSQRPIFLSGKVVLSDGSPLPDRARIERVCNGTPRLEGYTDRKGRFSIDLGHSTEMPDASSMGTPEGVSGRGAPGGTSRGALAPSPLWGCDLRASLPGYQSDRLPLSTIHYMDNPDVGTIILHPVAKVDGLTVSVTSALAPKDARKAYEKAHEALLKKNPDDAQKDFEKAVELYPKYSSAWYELGALNEQRDHFEEARKDYQQAIANEPKFLQPYERLGWLWLRDSKWQELADETVQWLKLDPANSPDAYYLNSVANLQLQHFDVAEQQVREAIKLDAAGKNPRAHYVLGLALAQEHKYSDSADSFRTFLVASPHAKDADVVREQLSQVEAAAKEQPAAAAQP
jgi:Flp pilus assembly protein TadD